MQAVTQAGANLKEIAAEHGWRTDASFLARATSRLGIILKRTEDCLNALSEQELAAYIQAHQPGTQHLSATQPRDAVVEGLMELRLPPPESTEDSSENFRRSLFNMMKR